MEKIGRLDYKQLLCFLLYVNSLKRFLGAKQNLTVLTKFPFYSYSLLPKILNGLSILPVKFTQNRQNNQRHFYSTSKIVRRLSKSIIGWNIHMTRSPNRKILASNAVIQRLTPQKYCKVFKHNVHVAANLRLSTVKFYFF